MTMPASCGAGGRLGRAALLLGALVTPSSSLLVDGGSAEIEMLLQKYDFAGNLSTMSLSEGQDLDATLLGKQKCKGTVPYAKDSQERRMWDLINQIMAIIKKYPKDGGGEGGKHDKGGKKQPKDGDCEGPEVCPGDKLDLYKYGGELAEILGKSIPIFFSGLEYFYTKQTARDGDTQFWEDIGKTGKGLGRLSRINGHKPGDKQFFMNFLLGYIAGDYDQNSGIVFSAGAAWEKSGSGDGLGGGGPGGRPAFDFELGYIVGFYRKGGDRQMTVGAETAFTKLVFDSVTIDDLTKKDLKVNRTGGNVTDVCKGLEGKYCGVTYGMSGITNDKVPSPSTKWLPVIPLWLIFYALDLKEVDRTNGDNHMALFGADLMGKLMGKHHAGDIIHKSDGKPYQFFFGGLGKGLDTTFDSQHNPLSTHWPVPFSNEAYYWLGFHLGLGTSSMLVRNTDSLDESQGTNINVYNHTGKSDNVYHLYKESLTGEMIDPSELTGVKHHDFKEQTVAVHIITDGVETKCFLIKNGAKVDGKLCKDRPTYGS